MERAPETGRASSFCARSLGKRLHDPGAPHVAVRRLEVSREARRVHERRGLHARAQTGPQLAQVVEIAAERDGLGDEVVGGRGHELGQAQVHRLAQAGASDDGRQLAAETAEAVFTGGGSLGDGQKLYADIKGRMDKLGRDRDHLKILPGAFVVVGDSVEEAREKRALLDSMVHYDSAISSLSVMLGTDASGFDPDGQLPPIPETNASKSGRQRLVDAAARDHLTVRQLAQRVGGYGGLSFVGTPVTIADQMEEWLTTYGCDGFNIMFPFLPAGLDDFVDRVVPELQRREIFRREYEGRSLRENLGLPRPKNRFFEG